MPLVRFASKAAADLSPAERADIYEGLSIALQPHDAAMANEARCVCESLREAEVLQLTFTRLLKDSAS